MKLVVALQKGIHPSNRLPWNNALSTFSHATTESGIVPINAVS